MGPFLNAPGWVRIVIILAIVSAIVLAGRCAH